jgi:hypothetical protein
MGQCIGRQLLQLFQQVAKTKQNTGCVLVAMTSDLLCFVHLVLFTTQTRSMDLQALKNHFFSVPHNNLIELVV